VDLQNRPTLVCTSSVQVGRSNNLTKGIPPHDVEEMELLQSQLWRPYLSVATNKQKKNKTMDEEDEWNGMFNELQQEYYIKYGHTAAVPPTYPNNPRLAL
jgi:hypothetical protein